MKELDDKIELFSKLMLEFDLPALLKARLSQVISQFGGATHSDDGNDDDTDCPGIQIKSW